MTCTEDLWTRAVESEGLNPCPRCRRRPMVHYDDGRYIALSCDDNCTKPVVLCSWNPYEVGFGRAEAIRSLRWTWNELTILELCTARYMEEMYGLS